LVGREIRNLLDQANVRERRCVVGAPVQWALTARADIPAELSREDEKNYLDLAIERSFPFGVEDLSISTSRSVNGAKAPHAFLAAIPVVKLEKLRKALIAARLKPVAVTFAITAQMAIGPKDVKDGVVLRVGEKDVDAALVNEGGLVSLRNFDDVISFDRKGLLFDTDRIARELRISMGCVKAAKQGGELVGRVVGRMDSAREFCRQMAEHGGRPSCSFDARDAAALAGVSGGENMSGAQLAASSVAAWWLGDAEKDFQFLPPQPNRLDRLRSRVSGRATLWLGGTAGAVAFLILLAFLVQGRILGSLESRWSRVEPAYTRVEALQDGVRRYRPWYGEDAGSLQILKALAEAFPAEGAVWARGIDIKEADPDGALSLISCVGFARDQRVWLGALEKLRNTKGVSNVQVQQLRGDSPIQFSLRFNWSEGV
jgi:hypothetical protein